MLSYVGAVEGEFFYIGCTQNIGIVNCIGHRKEWISNCLQAAFNVPEEL